MKNPTGQKFVNTGKAIFVTMVSVPTATMASESMSILASRKDALVNILQMQVWEAILYTQLWPSDFIHNSI